MLATKAVSLALADAEARTTQALAACQAYEQRAKHSEAKLQLLQKKQLMKGLPEL